MALEEGPEMCYGHLYPITTCLCVWQNYESPTDFLKNAINFASSDVMCSDLWRVDEASGYYDYIKVFLKFGAGALIHY